jgi:hypothetical protein
VGVEFLYHTHPRRAQRPLRFILAQEGIDIERRCLQEISRTVEFCLSDAPGNHGAHGLLCVQGLGFTVDERRLRLSGNRKGERGQDADQQPNCCKI